MKFKVGDKVRIISNNDHVTKNAERYDSYIGKICTIEEINNGDCLLYPYKLKEIDDCWEEEGLERVDDMNSVQIVRKPVDKKAKLIEYLKTPYGQLVAKREEIANKAEEIFNSNDDEGEITEVKYNEELSIKNHDGKVSIHMTLLGKSMGLYDVPKDQAKQLATALLEMCEE